MITSRHNISFFSMVFFFLLPVSLIHQPFQRPDHMYFKGDIIFLGTKLTLLYFNGGDNLFGNKVDALERLDFYMPFEFV